MMNFLGFDIRGMTKIEIVIYCGLFSIAVLTVFIPWVIIMWLAIILCSPIIMWIGEIPCRLEKIRHIHIKLVFIPLSRMIRKAKPRVHCKPQKGNYKL